MKDEYPVLINNEWVQTSQKLPVKNPYNDEVIAEVYRCSEAEVQMAIDAAMEAFACTRTMTSHERATILRKTRELIIKRGDELARTISLESGKPIQASRAEVSRAATTFLVASEEASRITGEVLPLDIFPPTGDRIGITRRFPIGPIGAITPFNFPLNLVAHKIAPAIASGNTVVHKPSSSTPITALLLGEILLEAGIPAGSVNIVPCSPEVAEAIIKDERVKMLSFTGSPDVGWALKAKSGKKKVSLELGGNAGVIIEPDADMHLAIERCLAGGYVNSGQVCISVQRIYIHESIYHEFETAFVKKVKGLKVGDPLLEQTDVGPLIEQQHVQRVHAWVEEAKAMRAKVLAGGKYRERIYEPTVLSNVPNKAKCVSREIFGPVTVLFSYRNFDDAICEVNNSRYGLQAGIFTKDIEKIMKAFNKLEVGGVMINEVPTFRVDNFPYGGVKDSGFGREGVKYAIEEMTEIRVMVVHNTY